MNILVLCDRDWTHPEAGGTGTTFRELVSRWTDAGHRVTMIVGAYPGAKCLERPHPNLEIHRMGNRLTVFPRAALAFQRGTGRGADVVLEVVNGIAFFTPLWPRLRVPSVLMVQHVHQEHYVRELGWRGRVGAMLLERLPLRHLYRRSVVCAISHACRHDLVSLGMPDEAIKVVYLGADPPDLSESAPPSPNLLYLGRLKRYKRLELLLDILERVPDVRLDVAGEGDHREAFEAEVERRGLTDRVVMHGFVSERAKAELYASAWVNVTTSAAEGWGLTVMEAASHGTPSAALRVGGLTESIVDGETGVLADDTAQLSAMLAKILGSRELRDRLGAAAARRARRFSWEVAAQELSAMLSVAVEARVNLARRTARRQASPAGLPIPADLVVAEQLDEA
jgi:glycosyltransferase involved in cell wall biosynthesis